MQLLENPAGGGHVGGGTLSNSTPTKFDPSFPGKKKNKNMWKAQPSLKTASFISHNELHTCYINPYALWIRIKVSLSLPSSQLVTPWDVPVTLRTNIIILPIKCVLLSEKKEKEKGVSELPQRYPHICTHTHQAFMAKPHHTYLLITYYEAAILSACV